MSRVATANAFEAGVRTLQARQSEMLEAQARLTSGKRVSRPSDDPVAAARAERAMAAASRADVNQRALESSRSVITLGEAALGDAGELMQQAREQLLAAGNGSWSSAERGDAAKSHARLAQPDAEREQPRRWRGWLSLWRPGFVGATLCRRCGRCHVARLRPARSRRLRRSRCRSPSTGVLRGCRRAAATACLKPK